jgi:hypothetical protein
MGDWRMSLVSGWMLSQSRAPARSGQKPLCLPKWLHWDECTWIEVAD